MNKKNISFLTKKIDGFYFKIGKVINSQYEIVEMIGGGMEGEVYLVKELQTKIFRGIKFFKPHRNIKNKACKLYAKKLNKLNNCQIIMNYISSGKMLYWGREIHFLVSEYIEGVTLSEFLNKQKGKRLGPLQSVLLLHSLVSGLEEMHSNKEYHGDLHLDNIMVQKFGLGFDLKVLDMFDYGKSLKQDYRDDLFDAIRIFYDVLGGKRFYSKHSDQIKFICCGLKKNLILKRFRNVSLLKFHLENLQWES